MSKIEYKTQGNSSPQGKPRVFVFFHQEDAVGKNGEKSPFDLVCEDILASQNCAIYYESELDNPVKEEELSSLLSDVQLFVMIVSTNFLFRNDIQNIRTIYSIASAHHTPILPIAVEYGIDKYFEDRMNSIQTGAGDVQFLDKTANDPTKIPYQEQLEKYLNSVLVGDKLAQRVRAAFDAYIFMSYRKIDRQYAQELMRLIHNIPFCRDIAIWYDEYLVPGEAFRDAIRDAMEKSRLVTIAVTPSLAEPNFISKHEYPYAKELKKEVIPAEVKKTDRALLKDLFEDMPEFVNGTDIDAMTERLQQLATTSNDESPEHNFLIGLAYLNAIDVERDADRALQLIQSAAEANLPEAIKKLVDMYNTGEGVQRDYDIAIEWQKKYISAIEGAEYDQQKIADAYIVLGDMELNVGDLDTAKEYYSQGLKICEHIELDSHSTESHRTMIVCYDRFGNLAQREKNITVAEAYFKKKLETCKKTHLTNEIESLYSLGNCYGQLGTIAKAEEKLWDAKIYFEKALKIFHEIVSKTNTSEARTILVRIYFELSEIFQIESNNLSTQALRHMRFGLFESQKIRQDAPMAQNTRLFAKSCIQSAKISQMRGNNVYAEQSIKEALKTFQQIASKTDTIESYRDLAICYEMLAKLAQTNDNKSIAVIYYQKCLNFLKKIARKTNNLQCRYDLARCYYNIGYIIQNNIQIQKTQNFSVAKKYFIKSCKILKQIASEVKTIESLRDLFQIYHMLGDIAQSEENFSDVKKYAIKWLKIREYIVSIANTLETLYDLSYSYKEYGDILWMEGKYAEAEKYFKKNKELIKHIEDASKSE